MKCNYYRPIITMPVVQHPKKFVGKKINDECYLKCALFSSFLSLILIPKWETKTKSELWAPLVKDHPQEYVEKRVQIWNTMNIKTWWWIRYEVWGQGIYTGDLGKWVDKNWEKEPRWKREWWWLNIFIFSAFVIFIRPFLQYRPVT